MRRGPNGGCETARLEGSEAVLDYMDAVAGLRDRRAIPFLIETSGSGQWATNALADLAIASVQEDARLFSIGRRGWGRADSQTVLTLALPTRQALEAHPQPLSPAPPHDPLQGMLTTA